MRHGAAAAQERQQRAAVQVGGPGRAGRFEQRGRDVDVERHPLGPAVAGEHVRAMRQHGHADRRLVHAALVDQAVVAQQEAVVAHVDHQRVVEQALFLQAVEHAPDALVERVHRAGVLAVERIEGDHVVEHAVHAVRGLALAAHPIRPAAVVLLRIRHRLGIGNRLVPVKRLVPRRADVGAVHVLVREVQEEGALPRSPR